MNIVLIGYRGSGKTTIGKALANQLWKTFADVDAVTCARFAPECDSIAAIWAKHGEPAWRKAEVEVTRELVAKLEMVIGLGGGTLMQGGAREAVEQAPGTVRIYLRCEPTELLHRIQADPQSAQTRPNLTTLGASGGGGLEEIEAVLREREPVYRAVADKELDVTHLAPEDALRFLIAKCL